MNKTEIYTSVHWLERDNLGILCDATCDKCGKPVGLLDDGITEKRDDGSVFYYHKDCRNTV